MIINIRDIKMTKIKNLENKIGEYIDSGKEFQFMEYVRKYFFEKIAPISLEEYNFVLDDYNYRLISSNVSKKQAKVATLKDYYGIVEAVYKNKKRKHL